MIDSSFTYDEANRLTNLTHGNSSNDFAFYDLSYDAASRITQITDVDGTNNYTYDNRDQLIAADHSDEDNADESYAYDANGNRINSSLHGDGYVTDANNRLVSDGIYNYEYDNQGNLIRQIEIGTGNIEELEWDYLNRLIAVVDKDSAGNETQRVEFTYDMFGRRLSKTVDGDAIYFVYDRDNVILDFVDSGSDVVLEKRYLHGARVDQVLAQEDGNGDVIWHLTDHLGTVKDLVDSSGVVVNHFVYDSYGNVVSQTDEMVVSRYLFTGREWDSEIGLYYYRARYYDATVGRFISQDPIGFEAGDANIYRYVFNSPLNYTDPTGLNAKNKSRYPLGHEHVDCVKLAEKIDKLKRQVDRKIEELSLDELKLPGTDPNDKLKPSLSRRGHFNTVAKYKADLAAAIAQYMAKCGDWPPPSPEPVNTCDPNDAPQDSLSPNSNPWKLPDMEIPNLWPTVPAVIELIRQLGGWGEAY